MARAKKIIAIDCETDPFLFSRLPLPFLWGMYDGKDFTCFEDTGAFVNAVIEKNVILYAHNGGKFDFIYLLPFVRETKCQIISSRIVSMMLGKAELRDSYSIIPAPLRDLGAKKEIDYWKLERTERWKHIREIREYLFTDCKVLYDAVTDYREIAGTKKTIASNALTFSEKLGVKAGKTNHHFDTQFRQYYYGGRTQCFLPGTHKNVRLIDIRSAYPYAMMHEHPCGSDHTGRDDLKGMTRDEIQRSFIEIECTSHGAFPIRSGGAAGLIFPEEYNLFKITGWEYVAAKELGLIENEKIISVRTLRGTINFRPYVNHWYEYKKSHPKKIFPAKYTIGKNMLNSLYGKLSQNLANYYDYKIVPATEPLDHANGWLLDAEYEEHAIHRRPSLWRYQYDHGKDWVSQKLYRNVATGASITGFTRSHLLRAMASVGRRHVIYCDTDSLAVTAKADISNIPLTDNLGDWELEEPGAPVGHFAGKKLYGITLSAVDEKTGINKTKIASKGARLKFGDIERIAKGETIQWQNEAPTLNFKNYGEFQKLITLANGGAVTVPEPVKEAGKKSVAGRNFFVVRKVRATAPLKP